MQQSGKLPRCCRYRIKYNANLTLFLIAIAQLRSNVGEIF